MVSIRNRDRMVVGKDIVLFRSMEQKKTLSRWQVMLDFLLLCQGRLRLRLR